MGKDTHAISDAAQRTALTVLAANGVHTIIQSNDGVTPTPTIIARSSSTTAGKTDHLADGIVITPSHNPPEDGGISGVQRQTNGGPADTDVTKVVEARANEILCNKNADVRRILFVTAWAKRAVDDAGRLHPAVREGSGERDRHGRDQVGGLKLGVDPLGGAAIGYFVAPICAEAGSRSTSSIRSSIRRSRS